MEKNIEFEKIDEDFLALSRTWLGDPAFRDLIMAEPVDEVAQLAWFDGLPNRMDYVIWGVKVSGVWVGACGLKHIDFDNKVAEYWGYIYPADCRGVGIGWEMFRNCRDHGLKIDMETLCLLVAKGNTKARDAYLRWGFAEVESKRPNAISMEIRI